MLSFSRSWTYGIVIAAALFLVGIGATTITGFFDEGTLDTSERDRYVSLEFLPKYNVSQCVVTFDFRSQGREGYLIRHVDRAFLHYLSKYEPKTGATVLEPVSPSYSKDTTEERYMLAFADQCDRKEEIFQNMASYAEQFYDYKIKIKRVSDDEPFKMVGNYWLDSPDYDLNYWPTLHKAMRGDGEALFFLTHFYDDTHHSSKYTFFALAELYLPDGPLKEEARIKKEAEFEEMFPEPKARAQEAIEYYKTKIESYRVQ